MHAKELANLAELGLLRRFLVLDCGLCPGGRHNSEEFVFHLLRKVGVVDGVRGFSDHCSQVLNVAVIYSATKYYVLRTFINGALGYCRSIHDSRRMPI